MKPTTIPMSRARDSPTLSPTPVPSTPLPTIFFSIEVPDRAEAALKKVEAGTVGDEQQKASAQQRADLVGLAQGEDAQVSGSLAAVRDLLTAYPTDGSKLVARKVYADIISRVVHTQLAAKVLNANPAPPLPDSKASYMVVAEQPPLMWIKTKGAKRASTDTGGSAAKRPKGGKK